MNIDHIQRGFDTQEFEDRLEKAQRVMREKELDAIFITTEPNYFYFTGLLTQFWRSLTRPYFLILPLEGPPIAVVPNIIKEGIEATWVQDIYTWDSPNPDDDGITLLASILKKKCKKYKRIGACLGQESQLRMPYNNFIRLQDLLSGIDYMDISMDIHKIKSVKSPAEIEKIKIACNITNDGFDDLSINAKIGQTERDICKEMTALLLRNGADSVPYLIASSGVDGYDSVIMGPTDKCIEFGDLLMLDTGATFDGYYSDFCRNFICGQISDAAQKANATLHHAIEAAFKIARPGATTTDLFIAMNSILSEGGAIGDSIGRLGHGLGCELTQWPSIMSDHDTVLEPGMVMTLEPFMCYKEGKSIVHEENIVITSDGAEWLSRRASPELVVLT